MLGVFRIRKTNPFVRREASNIKSLEQEKIMSSLRMLQVWIAMVVLSAGVAVVPGIAADSNLTFTGKVSDAMCGAKHSEGNIAPADCVRACVQKGG